MSASETIANFAPAMAGREVPLSKQARMMVRHMGNAWRAPMFALTTEIDMTASTESRSPGVTLTDAIIAACALSLREHPKLNAHFREEDGTVIEFADVNIGLAVATEQGLAVPVIHCAQKLSLTDIAAKRREIVDKTRNGQARIADLSGGTFTVSNLGMFDITRFTSIVNAPQIAILSIGATKQRHVWNNGNPQWRPIAEFTLTSDHRAVDGATGAAFLKTLKGHLESSQKVPGPEK